MKTLAELETALETATVEHNAALGEHSAADKRLSTARNNLNQIHKDIDAQVVALRGAAPWSTHWHEIQNPSRAVPYTPRVKS